MSEKSLKEKLTAILEKKRNTHVEELNTCFITGLRLYISYNQRALVIWGKQNLLLGPVVWNADNAIQQINRYPDSKTYSVIDRIEFYPVDSVIQPSNNRGLMFEDRSIPSALIEFSVWVSKGLGHSFQQVFIRQIYRSIKFGV